MQTYNLGYLLVICIARTIGNLIFGLVQDTIVIKKVKREKREMEMQKMEMADLNIKHHR